MIPKQCDFFKIDHMVVGHAAKIIFFRSHAVAKESNPQHHNDFAHVTMQLFIVNVSLLIHWLCMYRKNKRI